MPHGKPSKRAALWARIQGRQRRHLRMTLIERDGTKCHHCGVQTSMEVSVKDLRRMTVDHHPVPKRDLQVREWLNPARCVISCLGCNREKDQGKA